MLQSNSTWGLGQAEFSRQRSVSGVDGKSDPGVHDEGCFPFWLQTPTSSHRVHSPRLFLQHPSGLKAEALDEGVGPQVPRNHRARQLNVQCVLLGRFLSTQDGNVAAHRVDHVLRHGRHSNLCCRFHHCGDVVLYCISLVAVAKKAGSDPLLQSGSVELHEFVEFFITIDILCACDDIILHPVSFILRCEKPCGQQLSSIVLAREPQCWSDNLGR